jgi:predicted aldo/keto reductase-like oxidoreductase
MEYRKFGNTGLKISALGFGCMRLPLIGQDITRIDEKQATLMVHHAIDHGINYFDTAYPYHSDSFKSGGSSEPFLAKALKNGFRKKVHLATKLPSWLIASRADMDLFLEQQLRRLETETIDFYLLHSLNRKTWNNLAANGVFGFLEQAVASGKIRYAGFSFHDELDLFREITDAYPWDFCQIMYNYFDEDFQAGREGLHYAARKGLATVVMEPLRGGALVDGLPEEARNLLHQAVPGRSTVDWAFRWLWKQPEVSVVLSGMSHMDQLLENLELAGGLSGIRWTAAEQEAIQQVNGILHRLQRVSCTSCGYCMPCPNGVDIPRNFMLSNDYHMLNDRGARVRYFRLLGEAERASNCIQCGECLDKCPQHIPIPDELEYLAELFNG